MIVVQAERLKALELSICSLYTFMRSRICEHFCWMCLD
jgi:hypothetical protein